MKIFKTLAALSLGFTVLAGSAVGASAAPKAAPVDETIKPSIADVANQILTMYADGDITKGMEYKDAEKVMQKEGLEIAKSDVKMGIIYNADTPSVFSICAWTDSSEKSTTYTSPRGEFSPFSINCSGFKNLKNLELTQVANLTETGRPDSDKLDLDNIEAVAAPETPMADPSSEVMPPKTVEPKEEVQIPWATFGFVAAIIALFGVLFGIGVAVVKVATSTKRRKIEENENLKKWETYMGTHDAVKSEWFSYESDIVQILKMPLLSDMRDPATKEFHAALRSANNLRPNSAKSVSIRTAVGSNYAEAVDKLENSFAAAKHESERVKLSNFSVDERKRLEKARNLLNMAMNSAASESERATAYKRLFVEVEGLIVIPKTAMMVLEEKINLSITDGSENPLAKL